MSSGHGDRPVGRWTSSNGGQITLTVGRARGNGQGERRGEKPSGGVEAHLAYIGRDGELGVSRQTTGFSGRNKFQKQIVPDWDLDLMAHEFRTTIIRGVRPAGQAGSQRYFLNATGNTPAKVLKAGAGGWQTMNSR